MRYLASTSGVTLKTGLGFVQGHWKWHHLIYVIYEFLFIFHSNYGAILHRMRDIETKRTRYSDLLVENGEIFIPHLYLSSLMG